MTFGVASSPSLAQYFKINNSEKFAETHPRAVDAIEDRHYVEDVRSFRNCWLPNTQSEVSVESSVPEAD